MTNILKCADFEMCTVGGVAIFLRLQTDTVNVSCRRGGLGHCLRQRGSKSAGAILDLLTFVWLCQQMRHGRSGPFHGEVKYSLSLCSHSRGEEEGGRPSLCELCSTGY